MTYPTKKLGEVCNIITGSTPKTSHKEYFGNDILWAGPSDLGQGIFVLNTNKKLSKKGATEGGVRLIPKDSVLLSCIGNIGKIGIAVEEMATNQQINTFVPNLKILDSKYLYYALIIKTEEFKLVSSQTTLPIINKTKCSNIEIPLPSLEIQKKIVKILDEKFEKIKDTKKLREDALTDTEKILSQTLLEIFEEGKRKGWKEEALGDICEIARGGSPRPIQNYLTDDPKGINWIKISDATDSTKYIYTTRQKIKKEGLHKTRMVYPGDFILTNSMSFGRPYIMKTEGAIHDGWLLLRPQKELTEEYLYYFLSSNDIYRQFKQLAGGAVVQNLNSQLVKGVKILIPSLIEQKKIVERLDSLSEKIRQSTEIQKSQLEDLKKLEKAYLREAFNGELI
jgi:restriction endonuclease S subunit